MAKALYRGQPIQLLAAAARTTSSNSGNLINTAGNVPASEAVAFHLIWTTLTATSGATPALTLDVWIEDSPDGGTTWIPEFKFTQVTTSSGTLRINTRTTGIGIAEVGTIAVTTSNATAALNTNTVLAPDQRVRWEIAGAGGAATYSSNFAVFAVAMPPGTK